LQLSLKELQELFEETCDSDFQSLRTFVSAIEPWKDAVAVLERDQGAAWKLIFKVRVDEGRQCLGTLSSDLSCHVPRPFACRCWRAGDCTTRTHSNP